MKFSRTVVINFINIAFLITQLGLSEKFIVKFFFTIGILPKKYPAKAKEFIHNKAPKIQKPIYRENRMVPTPATNGAKVLMMGINRAMIIVLPPCFS